MSASTTVAIIACFAWTALGARPRGNCDTPPLLLEIETSLGASDVGNRTAQLEDELRPLFTALPKNRQGNLGPAAARYALHRLFRRVHAWLVKGLAPAGQAWNQSSPVGVLQDKVPEHVRGLFEQDLNHKGFTLSETALFASTIEELVYEETVEQLRKAYHELNIPVDTVNRKEGIESAMDLYMMSYILNDGKDEIISEKVRGQILKAYPSWPTTQHWVHKVLHDINSRHEVTFSEASRAVRRVSSRFGRWQNHECLELKQTLMALEGQCPGRVDLGEFHGSSLHEGKWQFSESKDYLRELGALDESNPEPTVIIPNYIDSAANYVANAKFHSVVCLDECETLMSQLEKTIAAPAATPKEIADIVKTMPSSTMTGSRALHPALMNHLNQVAEVHGGQVPLHGRLFAQWMHHAYPRECSYPQYLETAISELPQEFKAKTGLSDWASKTEKKASEKEERVTAEAEAAALAEEKAQCIPWTAGEELVAPVPPVERKLAAASEALSPGGLAPEDPEAPAAAWAAGRAVPLLIALVSMGSLVYGLSRYLGKGRADPWGTLSTDTSSLLQGQLELSKRAKGDSLFLDSALPAAPADDGPSL